MTTNADRVLSHWILLRHDKREHSLKLQLLVSGKGHHDAYHAYTIKYQANNRINIVLSALGFKTAPQCISWRNANGNDNEMDLKIIS